MADQFDVVIIGGGPGGYAAALYGAAAGLNVCMIERDKVGGTCLHRGCIPAKELLESAHVMRTVAHAADFGVETSAPTITLATTMTRKQQVIDGLWKGLEGLLKGRKVTVLSGTGRYRGGGTVQVGMNDGSSQTVEGRNVILASGSAPRTIPGFDVDGRFVLTSDEVLAIDELPRTAAVIGGGAIGCEFASFLVDVGVQVTLLEGLPKILPGCDADIANVVLRSFKKRGIDVRTGVKVLGHEPGESTTRIQIEGAEPLEVDKVVISVGRRPLAETLGLEGTGVEVTDRGFVKVDETCRTSVPGVWAIGDLIATPQLAHVGFAEAIVAIKDILGESPVPVAYDRVPWAIYCHPEVAFAGHSEESAKEAGYDIVVSKHQYRGNGRAMIVGDVEGMVKVIAAKGPDGRAGQILGVHMVGPWVTEQLGQAYLAVNWEATVDEVAHYIQPHPTLSELFGETVMALTGRGLHG
ncbi:MAG TPA: dihydrolipoyl dehydrogenase [Acidimicrobiales bacterium]|nr:dihydrolipoyl dehydrogenase [Acidimicrobiales bacterium]